MLNQIEIRCRIPIVAVRGANLLDFLRDALIIRTASFKPGSEFFDSQRLQQNHFPSPSRNW